MRKTTSHVAIIKKYSSIKRRSPGLFLGVVIKIAFSLDSKEAIKCCNDCDVSFSSPVGDLPVSYQNLIFKWVRAKRNKKNGSPKARLSRLKKGDMSTCLAFAVAFNCSTAKAMECCKGCSVNFLLPVRLLQTYDQALILAWIKKYDYLSCYPILRTCNSAG